MTEGADERDVARADEVLGIAGSETVIEVDEDGNVTNPAQQKIADLFAAVRAEGREKGLEEAARLMESTTMRSCLVDGEVRPVLAQGQREAGASARARGVAIRALKAKPAEEE